MTKGKFEMPRVAKTEFIPDPSNPLVGRLILHLTNGAKSEFASQAELLRWMAIVNEAAEANDALNGA